jgi:hypothetical protein
MSLKHSYLTAWSLDRRSFPGKGPLNLKKKVIKFIEEYVLCGTVALWCCGTVALWHCGVVALWHCGAEGTGHQYGIP